MNNDLISREALKNDLITYFPDKCLDGVTAKTLFKQILTDIDNAPTVEINTNDIEYKAYCKGLEDGKKIARPQGKWVMHIDETFPNESTQECNVCHAEQTICGNDDNFCPNCGANMRKEDKK